MVSHPFVELDVVFLAANQQVGVPVINSSTHDMDTSPIGYSTERYITKFVDLGNTILF